MILSSNSFSIELFINIGSVEPSIYGSVIASLYPSVDTISYDFSTESENERSEILHCPVLFVTYK
jgi:hypothetical protein